MFLIAVLLGTCLTLAILGVSFYDLSQETMSPPKERTLGTAAPARSLPSPLSLSNRDEGRTGSPRQPPPPSHEIAQGALSCGTSSSFHYSFPNLPACALTYFENNFKKTCNHPLRVKDTRVTGTPVSHTYMVHYTPLKARREVMISYMKQHELRVDWVTGFDKEDITDEQRRCFHSNWEPNAYKRKEKASRHRDKSDKYPELKWSQVSVVTKHHSALYDAHRNEHNISVILEDDAFLHAGFTEHLTVLFREAPRDWDVLMIGGCFNMHGNRPKFKAIEVSKHFYRKTEARCAHAYIVNLHAARMLIDSVPLTMPIDFQMTAAMKETKLNCYWVEPFLAVQGNLGGCVTNDIGAKCVSAEKKIKKEFLPENAKDPRFRKLWLQ